MRILQFDIKNDRAIESFFYEPNGAHVQIAGEAGTGKTTCASALWDIAFANPDTLTHGERKGHITLHLGEGQPDLIAERQFTKKTSTVIIKRADGTDVSVKEFRAMISSLSANPHKIVDMKPTERVKTLLAAADLGDVSLDDMDTSIAKAEDDRLQAKRRADDHVPGDEPEEVGTIDVAEVAAQMEAMLEANSYRAQIETRLEATMDEGKQVAADLAQRKAQIAELERQRDVMRASHKRDTEFLDKTETQDTTHLRAQLDAANETNEMAARYATWQERRAAHVAYMEARDEADSSVKKLREQKKSLLENAAWPLDGLSVEDGDVWYNGALFTNLGNSEQMLVCAALSINNILAHPLHVVRMDGVESMSPTDFEKLQALFGENDIQVISTRVSRGDVGEGELVITEAPAKEKEK